MKILFKSIALVVIIFSLGINLYSQEQEKMETLFGSGKTSVGGYGGPEVKFAKLNSKLNNDWGVLLGLRGGVILNSALSFGGAGYLLFTDHKIKNSGYTADDVYLRFGYGGVFLEYINSSNSVVHFTLNSLIGAGGAAYTGPVWCEDCHRKWIYEGSGFFVFEPGATIDVNLLKNIRLSFGASYRIIAGLDLRDYNNNLLNDSKDLQGLSANIMLKFGDF